MIFQRLYNALLFAIVLWGFTAILMTGEYSPLIVLVCYGFTALAFFTRRIANRVTSLHWNILTMIAFVVAVIIAFRDLLDATVYFFMFLQIAKLFNNRSASDTLWIYSISFFLIVGACVVTSSIAFGMIFIVYVMLMTASFILFTIRRQSELTERTSNSIRERLASALGNNLKLQPRLETNANTLNRVLPRTFIYSSSIITIFILLTTGSFFIMIPRLSSQKLFENVAKRPDPNHLSAFDEAVEFGNFDKIQLDSSVALYVRPLDDGPHPGYIRLRGVALDNFDGKRWSRTNRGKFSGDQTIAFRPFSHSQYAEQTAMVIQPPGVTNFLFASTFPENVKFDFGTSIYYDDLSNSAWLAQVYPKNISYVTTSRVENLEDRKDPVKSWPGDYADLAKLNANQKGTTTTADALNSRRVSHPGLMPTFSSFGSDNISNTRAELLRRFQLPPSYMNNLLKVPDVLKTDRMIALSHQLTSSKNTPFEKAMSVETHLRTHYGYSLEQKARGNYIEDFLFRTKEGHCEFFATSMVMLLRLSGIPARIVNGYYCVEWNDIGKHFTVRQRDAHSWVEVYFERYGWMTFDPTPPSGIGRMNQESVMWLAVNRLIDGLKVRWYRYIIDYSFNDQRGIVKSALSFRGAISRFLRLLGNISPLQHSEGENVKANAWSLVILLLLVVFILALIAISIKLIFTTRLKLRNRHNEHAPVVKFYAEILKLLKTQGYTRQPGQTPREFARVVAAQEDLQQFSEITEIYYRTRFALIPPVEQQNQQIQAFLHHLRQRLHRKLD